MRWRVRVEEGGGGQREGGGKGEGKGEGEGGVGETNRMEARKIEVDTKVMAWGYSRKSEESQTTDPE